jgi:hypothetical protein
MPALMRAHRCSSAASTFAVRVRVIDGLGDRTALLHLATMAAAMLQTSLWAGAALLAVLFREVLSINEVASCRGSCLVCTGAPKPVLVGAAAFGGFSGSWLEQTVNRALGALGSRF